VVLQLVVALVVDPHRRFYHARGSQRLVLLVLLVLVLRWPP
jgi:hypothetical protein